MNKIFSNMCYSCNGHSFDDIDESSQEAIIYDVSTAFSITNTEAEDLVRALYYKSYYDGDELRVNYEIPGMIFDAYMSRLNLSGQSNTLTFSNMCFSCESNAFDDIDESSRDAILYDVSSALQITNTNAEDLIKALYYKPYYDGGELRVEYVIPSIITHIASTKVFA